MRLSDLTPEGELARAGVLIFGVLAHRGKCPTESVEQVTFFNRLRAGYPDTLGLIAIHTRNEGLKRGAHISAVAKHRAEGMTPGAADIIIPARVPFVCEMKRQDPTQCAWQDGQQAYLIAAARAGAFACVAFGCDAAWQALLYWQARHGVEYDAL